MVSQDPNERFHPGAAGEVLCAAFEGASGSDPAAPEIREPVDAPPFPEELKPWK